MRQLVLMRGCIGSGKSTWIRQNGLEDYTLSADKIRVLAGSYATTDIDGNLIYQQKDESFVWDLLFKMLENRMAKGEFTVIDAQHATRKSINAYKTLAHKYNYTVYVVEMPKPSLDELHARIIDRNTSGINLEDNKYIKESVVDNSYYRIDAESVPHFAIKCNSDNASEKIGIHPLDLSKYNGLAVFGDIHSSYRVLKEAWDKENIEDKLNNNWLVVCVGDLFDRGTRPVETFIFLEKEKNEHKNLVLLMGNHDFNLYNEVFETKVNPPQHTHNDTTEPLNRAGISNKRIRRFLRKFNDALFLHSKEYVLFNITHGGINVDNVMQTDGINPFYFSKIPALEMIYGSGKFADGIDKVMSHKEGVITIHGHRNVKQISPLTPGETGGSYNLEQGIDEGRNLAIYFYRHNSIPEVKLYKNYEFNINSHLRKQLVDSGTKHLLEDPKTFILEAKKSPFVKLKEVAPDIVSVNFTREAFFKEHWDDITIKARGLFINTRTNKVIARGYNKFFRAGEKDDWSTINEHAPFVIYKKYNGFLGLMSYDETTDKFIFCSKSQISNDKTKYADLVKETLLNTIDFNKQEDYLKEVLKDKTALFEIVDETFDPHVIHNFEKPTPVLLDIVNSNLSDDFVNNHFKYSELLEFANTVGLFLKEYAGRIEAGKDVRSTLEKIVDKEPETEGYVVESLMDGYQTKGKTYLYTSSKYARSLLNKAHNKKMTGEDFLNTDTIVHYSTSYMIGQRRDTRKAYDDLLQAIAKELDSAEPETNILRIRKKYKLILD